MNDEQKNSWDELQKEMAGFNDIKPTDVSTMMTVHDIGPVAPPTTIPGKNIAVSPGYPAILGSDKMLIPASLKTRATTGRRTALAHWMTRDDNPLTTRVIVNRIWQLHFGTGIVASANDFGRLGTPPTHPELLDWLTQEFIRSGWSIKHMHRLIMSSATYQQQAVRTANTVSEKTDPDNHLLWRMPIRRLKAEQIRDAMLVMSGELDTTSGGESDKGNSARRSIFLRTMRNSPDEMLCAFDAPEGFNSVARRNVTTNTNQALFLLNSPWTIERANGFVDRLSGNGESIEEIVDSTYRWAYGRLPDSNEKALALAFVQDRMNAGTKLTISNEASRRHESLVDYAHVLMNSSEFLYIE